MITQDSSATSLPSYQYVSLDHSIKETRLVELLPGIYDDDLRIKIQHVSLDSSDVSQPSPLGFSVEDLQKDLPADWVVRETINGRFIFERKRDYAPQEQYDTSWVHPRAHFEPFANNYNLLNTKPEYEALSHVWGPPHRRTLIFVHDSEDLSDTADNDPSNQQGVRDRLKDSFGKRYTDDQVTLPPVKRFRTAANFGPPSLDSSLQDNSESSTTRDDLDTITSSLPIGEELATALRHLRFENRSRMLWIDNICIDQSNTSERSHLVRNMGQIYRLAQKVIVWIGPESDDSKLAMSKLQYLGRQVELTNKGSWRVNAPACLEPTWSRTATELPYDDMTWDAIINLLKRPWFKRLWVWQEAKLSNDDSIIQCGYTKMELYRFGAAAWCAAAKSGSIPAGLRDSLFRAGDAVLRQFDEPFLNTLLHLNAKECSDPRDKVYGALGLAPPQVADKIIPDYRKRVDEVYTDAVAALCEATGRVDFLLACDLAKRTLPGPTWAPDWSVVQRLSPRWLLSTTLASGISISEAEIIHTPKPTLLVHGVEWGTIRSVGARAPDEISNLEGREAAIRSWAPKSFETQMYVTQTESLLDAFVKTVLWNSLRERCPLDTGLLTLSEAREAIRYVLSQNDQGDPPNEPGPEEKRHRLPYREALGRSYIELDNEYIGMTSAVAEENDVVCIILGCPLPMILRRHSSGRFQVVGPAYIHALMDAEGILGPLHSDYIVQIGASYGWYGGSTFRRAATNESVPEDPRLGEVPPSWVRTDAVRTPTDPLHFVRFRDLATGKAINGDPRLLPDSLRARGVPLKPLKLV